MDDFSNRFMVSMQQMVVGGSRGLVIMRPPPSPLSRKDAFVLAAWLVAMAEVLSGDEKFEDVLNAVQNT